MFCEETPDGRRVGRRVKGHVVDHDGGREMMLLRWLISDVDK